jgi:hypothetical protein
MSVNTFGIPGVPTPEPIYEDTEVRVEKGGSGHYLVFKFGLLIFVSSDPFESLAYACDKSKTWEGNLGL